MRETSDLSGRRVLLIEDEWVVAHETARAFERHGAIVLGPVPTIEQALALVNPPNPPPDMAVIDINLRGELAFAVADALDARGVRYVFATGYDISFIPNRYRHVARCEKPVDPSSLLATLRG